MTQPITMPSLPPKRITLALTGGIAVYKACEVVRALKHEGYSVHVAMSAHATEFVSALTFETLSGNPVALTEWVHDGKGGMPHIDINQETDLLVVMPATANIIAKAARGIADDLVSTLIMARRSPMLIVPAMNRYMWANPATQRNVALLKEDGVMFAGPVSGEQACGDVGAGRMMAVEDILDCIRGTWTPKTLAGRHVLITAGPTYEAIDDVRGITNRSSGKQGYAIAQAAREAGARVTLVSGPVALRTPEGVKRLSVESARDMLEAVDQVLDGDKVDAFVSVAAVADWHVENAIEGKWKKTEGGAAPALKLVENPDILSTVAHRPVAPLCVGFAAEATDIENYARQKCLKKGCIFVVANQARTALGNDYNTVLLVDPEKTVSVGPADKLSIARAIVARLGEELTTRNDNHS